MGRGRADEEDRADDEDEREEEEEEEEEESPFLCERWARAELLEGCLATVAEGAESRRRLLESALSAA